MNKRDKIACLIGFFFLSTVWFAVGIEHLALGVAILLASVAFVWLWFYVLDRLGRLLDCCERIGPERDRKERE